MIVCVCGFGEGGLAFLPYSLKNVWWWRLFTGVCSSSHRTSVPFSATLSALSGADGDCDLIISTQNNYFFFF